MNEVELHAFLNSTIYDSEWSVSRSCSLDFVGKVDSSRLHKVRVTGILNICCHITTMD
jgi:hypothetical protein